MTKRWIGWVFAGVLTLGVAAVGCGSSSDSSSGGPGGGGGQSCNPVGSTFNCSALDACATSGSNCWYNATKGGSTQQFSCAAGCDCQAAAQQAIQFCQ